MPLLLAFKQPSKALIRKQIHKMQAQHTHDMREKKVLDYYAVVEKQGHYVVELILETCCVT